MKKIALLVSLVMILSFSMTCVLATESGNENDITPAISSGEDLQNSDDESGNVNDTLIDDSGEDDMLLGEDDEPTDYADSGEELSGDVVIDTEPNQTEESSSSNGAIVGAVIAIAIVIAVVVIAAILRKK